MGSLPCTGLVRCRWCLTSHMHSASMNSYADRISPSSPLQVLKVCRTSAKPGQPAEATGLRHGRQNPSQTHPSPPCCRCAGELGSRALPRGAPGAGHQQAHDGCDHQGRKCSSENPRGSGRWGDQGSRGARAGQKRARSSHQGEHAGVRQPGVTPSASRRRDAGEPAVERPRRLTPCWGGCLGAESGGRHGDALLAPGSVSAEGKAPALLAQEQAEVSQLDAGLDAAAWATRTTAEGNMGERSQSGRNLPERNRGGEGGETESTDCRAVGTADGQLLQRTGYPATGSGSSKTRDKNVHVGNIPQIRNTQRGENL